VDVVSHWNCHLLEHGWEPMEKRIDRLQQVAQSPDSAEDETEKRAAALFTSEVRARIEEHLDWMRQNSVPAAMEWRHEAQRQPTRLQVVAGGR
jgi:hypothetical protein